VSLIGEPTPRIDGVQKVTGGVTYVSDMVLPRMAHGKILRSNVAHALIKKIDTSEAEKMEGVFAVVTAEDTPKRKFSFSGGVVPDEPDKLILCDDKVRYIGDEVAAVAAETEEVAEEAVRAIVVEYEELGAVFDPEEAMKEGAPKVHERGNLAYSKVYRVGNVEEAFRQPGLVFVEGTFTTQKAAHVCFETRGCIAEWNEATGDVRLIATTQSPHTLKQELGRALDIPPSKVHVIYPPSGGGFGSKLVMSPIEPIAAVLSRKAGRPVKIVNTREEEFTVSRTDYPCKITARLGLTREGKMVGIEATVVGDNGAYNDKGPAVLLRSTLAHAAHYDISNIKVASSLVYTNKQYCTSYRGFGKPQAVFEIESLVDMAAEKVGMDPVKFRQYNATAVGSKTPSGVPIFTDGLEQCVQEAAKRIGWWEREKSSRDLNRRYLRGFGFGVDAGTAAGNRKYGFNATEAFIMISEEGRARLVSGAVEIGTGAATSLCQIVADILGLRVSDIDFVGYDTDVTAYDLGIFANRTLFVHGNAADAAAKNAREELFKVASQMLSCEKEDLVIEAGSVHSKVNPSKKVEVKDVAKYSFSKLGKPISAKGQYIDEEAPLAPGGKVPIDPTYSFSAHAAEVEVDTDTGVIKILKYVAAHDSGTIINPLTAKGVVIGGTIQGVAYTLMEDLMMENGGVVNPNFLDYKIPSMEDYAFEVEVAFVTPPDPLGPFGAKGLGENAVAPPVAAIVNAIYDATGIRFFELPITSVKVLEAIGKAKVTRVVQAHAVGAG
jgi:CO/xanthine dehydrogenase Mo-binding subunit